MKSRSGAAWSSVFQLIETPPAPTSPASRISSPRPEWPCPRVAPATQRRFSTRPSICSGAALSRASTTIEFAADEARRLDDVRISIEEDLAEVELDLGRHTAAAERLDHLVADNPLRERLVAALMTALYRGGRHAEALAVYRRHASLLGEELGLEPTPQLAELEERILVHDRALVLGTSAQPETAAPSALVRPVTSSIAVLPFSDLSVGQDQGYFADGVAVEVIRMLSRLDGMRVASRSSSFAYRDSPIDIRRIGTELGVTSILEGSVRRQDDRVRITVGLTDALDGFQTWVETYDRALDDIFSIQEDIARSVMEAMSVQLETGAGPRSAAPSTAAYDLYLRGMHHFYRGGLGYTKQAIFSVRGGDEDRPQLLPGAGRSGRRLLVPSSLLRAESRVLGGRRDLRGAGRRGRFADGRDERLARLRPRRRRSVRRGAGPLRSGSRPSPGEPSRPAIYMAAPCFAPARRRRQRTCSGGR